MKNVCRFVCLFFFLDFFLMTSLLDTLTSGDKAAIVIDIGQAYTK
jgi:hypothetical protein